MIVFWLSMTYSRFPSNRQSIKFQTMDHQLRLIWSRRLGLEPEEIEDDSNFFELDGDSLRAIQIVADAAAEGIVLSVQTLYAHPTIGELSSHLSTGQKQKTLATPFLPSEDPSVIIYPKSLIPVATRVAPVSPTQETFLELHERGEYPLCTYVYEVQGEVCEVAFLQALKTLTAKHPTLRTTWAKTSTGYCQVLLSDSPVQFSTSTMRLEDHYRQVKAQVLPPGQPIVRYDLVRDDGGLTFLTIAINHAFTDVFSRSIIEQDLIQALQRPEEVHRDTESSWVGSFVQFLGANHSWEAEKEYWRRHMQGSSMELLYKTLSDAKSSASIKQVVKDVPSDSSHQVGISTVIVTAWCLALARHSGLRDFGLLNMSMSRTVPFPGIDRLVGPLFKLDMFRFRLRSAHGSIQSTLHDVQHELSAHDGCKYGMPWAPTEGLPEVQCLLNIKLGSRQTQPLTAGDMSILPRQDLESWDLLFQTGIYLMVGPDPEGFGCRMNYRHAHISDEQAKSLFGDFTRLLGLVGRKDACIDQLVGTEERNNGGI
ncbi:condensation domain-domain-containing protein [Aspergillus taichungensis]|uniref:Condensation domain-domain-containing protein n=1 Tax=Aspergillus taichungensis TaxID=482145 RepID=A0A2J5HXG6_9EURO|nr:condensation domain-domain-containing protein [Aspergillus taichungensis]